MPTCYLVIGTPRSGTSLVAGILHYLGIRMGEYIGKDRDGITDRWDFGDANEWNPKGFFQDSAFVNFGTEIYGFPPDNPRRLTTKEREQLAELINKRSKLGLDWGVKEPTIAFYLDDFLELCPNEVKFIVLERDQVKSGQSWSDRLGVPLADATALIERVKSAIVARSRAVPALTVSFDDLIDKSSETVSEIAKFVERDVTTEALAMPDERLRRY